VIKNNFRYLLFGFVIFSVFALASFLVFRQWRLHLSVKLAKVEYRDAMPRYTVIESKLKPMQSWGIPVIKGGKVGRIFAKNGDLVAKGQILTIVNEKENRTALLGAIAQFKIDAATLGKLKQQTQNSPAFLDAKTNYTQSRAKLESAKQNLEASFVRAPNQGNLVLSPINEGELISEGTTLGTVEDWSHFLLLIQLPLTTRKEIPDHARISISLASRKEGAATSIESEVVVQATTFQSEVNGSNVDLKFILPTSAELTQWLHQTVRVKLQLRDFSHVALIDKSVVVTKDGDSKIMVLNASGLLHWQAITGAALVDGKWIVEGVEPSNFRVVIPEDKPLLNKAAGLNVRPKVISSG
jgi:biotin carboxyl carrier protein